MSDDPFKKLRESFESIHGDLAISVARFAKPKIPTIEQMLPQPISPLERFDGARAFIDNLLNAINTWRDSDPQNESAPVSLVMADGRYMFLSELKPLGFHGFIAEGVVDGTKCVVTGHVNTLMVVGVVLSKAHEMGYTAKTRGTST